MEQDWIAGPIAEIASQFGYPEVTEKDEERLTTDIRSQAARSIHLPPENPGVERLELNSQYMFQRLRIASLRHYKPPTPSSNAAVDATLTSLSDNVSETAITPKFREQGDRVAIHVLHDQQSTMSSS
jgi:hypothetical protein